MARNDLYILLCRVASVAAAVPAAVAAVLVQRMVYVDNPDLGYVKGNQEIPPGAAFELELEMLSAVPAAKGASSSSG
jgi:hypothetical protein